MSPIELIVFVVLCWWMIFFVSLPIGFEADDAPIKGQASSAPKNPRVLLKMGIATVLTVIITLIFNWYMG